MELNELKNTWLSLDERLRKQELLKENILKEMLQAKSNKALSRLVNFEFLGIVLTILGIPFLIFMLAHENFYPIQIIFMYFITGYAVVGIFFQLRKVYILLKIDFSKSVRANIRLMQRFNIQIKWEKIISFSIIPLMALFILSPYFTKNVEMWRWVAIIAVFLVVAVIAYWQYKKIYDKNIGSILKSLEELKELEEDNE